MAEENKEMTRAQFMQLEHEIQTGVRKTLPDGREISDVQAQLRSDQKAQDAEIAMRGAKQAERSAQTGGEKVGFMDEKVEVAVFENGVMSATAISEPLEVPQNADGEPESDLPEDFPARETLIAAGIVNLETVAGLDQESLIGIKGIKDATAEKILSYGKSE